MGCFNQLLEERLIMYQIWRISWEAEKLVQKCCKKVPHQYPFENQDALQGDDLRPTSSEVNVFDTFVTRLNSFYNQLDYAYDEYRYIIDRLFTAVYIPSIKTIIRDRMPPNALQDRNIVENKLNDLKNSEGSSTACTVSNNGDGRISNYPLGNTYGGGANKCMKKPYLWFKI